ncbi:hypothetical protein BGX38DRAFT_1203747 [Terfezia claveryi]|nr:hypothetical protein BGX38DRAFT_1203747 [Terfezia claveryi]
MLQGIVSSGAAPVIALLDCLPASLLMFFLSYSLSCTVIGSASHKFVSVCVDAAAATVLTIAWGVISVCIPPVLRSGGNGIILGVVLVMQF